MPLTLGWYFHLPPCATAQEVRTLVDHSLRLLLDAHRQARAKVGIAVTGCLLACMEGRHDDSLAALAEAVANRIVEPFATTYYEVCPFLVPPRYLRRQIELDLAIKKRLLGSRPVVFWPGNFAWAPVLANLLPELGLQTTLVDEAHVVQARQTQLWRWVGTDALRMESQLVDTVMEEGVWNRPYRLHASTNAALGVRVQCSCLRRELSFGMTGAIHHAWDDAPLDALMRKLRASGACGDDVWVFSGDDGDRINPVSIHQYRMLLQQLGPELSSVSEPLQAIGEAPLDFLPAYAPGGVAFWQDSVTVAWLRVLDELYRAVDLGTCDADELLALQDVFPIFWKRIARARWFHERAWELLRHTGAGSSSDRRRADAGCDGS
jgi:hypothetical protein